MPEWVKVLILGFVEGVTEFLPISSTGHLLITSALLDFQNSLGGTFEIFIQVGAVVAVIGFYRVDLWQQVSNFQTDNRIQRLWLNIIIASIPAAIAGLLVRNTVKDIFSKQDSTSLTIIAMMLILGGIVFLVVERYVTWEKPTNNLYAITRKQALLVGLAQTTALVPGVSRSGASIIGALLVGIDRPTATAFSFYLAIPVLGGATILDLLLSLNEIDMNDMVYLAFGTVVSAIIAWIAIGWLLRYVARNNLVIFGYYRVVLGISILIVQYLVSIVD